MGAPKEPEPVKLVVGMLGAGLEALERGLASLRSRFGSPDVLFDPVPFAHTRYYADELGPELQRSFASFPDLIPRESIPEIKLWTNAEEAKLTRGGKRTVNLDPGYLTPGQLFLASTKDQRQRVYIRDGIYVEPTLYFRDGAFHPFEWTYPDYRNGNYFGFLNKARDILLRQLRGIARLDTPGA